MRGDLADGEGYAFSSTALAQSKSGSNVDGNAALEVGQGKGVLAIATVRGADEIKKRIIL
jgi:hypothetical protein